MELLLFLFSFMIVIVGGTFIHELGHAIGAKLVSYEDIKISIGSGREIGSVYFINIEWKFHALFFLGGFISYETSKEYHPLDITLVAMMGPLFNGLLVFLLDIFINVYLHYSLYIFFLFNAWLLIANIIPLKWKDKQSDGYIIIKMIREHMFVQPIK